MHQGFYEDIIGPYWPPERAYVKDQYRTLPFPFADEITPPKFQMSVSWDLAHLLGYFRSWSATKAFIKAKGFDPVDALGEQLASLWGTPNSTRLFTLPLFMRVAWV